MPSLLTVASMEQSLGNLYILVKLHILNIYHDLNSTLDDYFDYSCLCSVSLMTIFHCFGFLKVKCGNTPHVQSYRHHYDVQSLLFHWSY